MRRSDQRILTTHVGSLPERTVLDPGAGDYATRLQEEVGDIVARQRDLNIDIINEGEYSKAGDWISYAEDRFGGFELDPLPTTPMILRGRDREEFADYYRHLAERGARFSQSGEQSRARRPCYVCTGPITYRSEASIQREIDSLKTALNPGEEAFITATAPGSLEVYRRNDFYDSDEAYVFALAEAMAVEYRAIARSGLLLQVDDAWLTGLWDRIGVEMGMVAFLRYSRIRIDALNHALKGIPEEQVRYHLCWGSWTGPHAHDIDLAHLVDLMLEVKAGAYLIEAANARHEHEHAVWQNTRLPPGKILIPGCITHSTEVVEHPDLVSERIQRFARAVGPENVIAGADCGFGGRSHPQIAWAKLKSLVEGAARASRALGMADGTMS